jgi:hypothetical protein
MIRTRPKSAFTRLRLGRISVRSGKHDMLSITPAVVLVTVTIWAATGQGRSADEHVRLVLNVPAVSLVFGPPSERSEDRTVLFVGEPVEVTFTLVNATGSEIELAESWAERLQLEFRRKDSAAIKLPVQRLPAMAQGARAVGPRGKLVLSYQVAPQGGGTLPPGLYVVKGSLAPAVLENRSVHGNDALSVERTVEIRAVESPIDELNVLFGSAVRARGSGDTARAKALVEELIRRAPNSPIAHAEMGAIFKAEHDCAAANAAYQRAVSLAQSGVASDDRILRNRHALDEWTTELSLAAAACR